VDRQFVSSAPVKCGAAVLIDETEAFVDLAFLSLRCPSAIPRAGRHTEAVGEKGIEFVEVRAMPPSVNLNVAQIRESFIADMRDRVMLTSCSAFRGLPFAAFEVFKALEAVLRSSGF
jgi:hypothetical protein